MWEIVIYNIIFWSVLVSIAKVVEKSFQAAIDMDEELKLWH